MSLRRLSQFSVANKVTRLVFVEERVTWTDDNWSKVHIRDESIFNLVSSDGHQYERRRTVEMLLSKCVEKSGKFGGRSDMVRGMLSATGVGLLVRLNGKVNANVYQKLLQQDAVPFLRAFPSICNCYVR